MNDQRLGMSITDPATGRIVRWGPDEPDGQNIPNDLTFSTSIPGGFKDLSCSLLRRIDLDYADQSLFSRVRVYGAGNRTAWQGRMVQFPRSHGDSFNITPGAVGMSATMRDNPTFREVYVDRDLSRWGDPPLARRISLGTSGQEQGTLTVANGFGGISWDLPASAVPDEAISELHYDAGPGVSVGSVMYRGSRTASFPAGFETPTLYTASTEGGAWGSAGALTFDDTLRTITASNLRYALVRLYLPTGPVTPAAGQAQRLTKLAAYGNHGLTKRAITGEPSGFYLSDLINDVIARQCPTLKRAISTNTFIVPHATYPDLSTAEDVVMDLNKYAQWHWGVYENDTFFYRQPDPARLTWETRKGDGAQLDFDGDTAEQVFNGVIVLYQTGDGQPMSVGPTGLATVEATDASLKDTTSTNPVNAAGLTRYAILSLSTPTTLDGAITIGAAYLAEKSLPQRRGRLIIPPGVAHSPSGAPTWMIRAGDYVKITDLSTAVNRLIIETTYNHSDGSVTCSLDNTSAKLDSIIERMGVALIGVF